MSPAKPRPRKASKAKSARKAARPAKRRKSGTRAPPRRTAARKATAGKAAPRPGAMARGGSVHAHCAATDPFGGPCQNVPRRPSRYCVIHSYLDR